MDESQFMHEVETLSGLTREQSFKVTTATLQELHDRLSPKEADHLAAQLPHEFKARWHALDAPGRDVRRSHREDFIRHIGDVAEIDEVEANKALKAVFKTLQKLLKSPTGQEGEAWDVFSQLPKDLKRVWLSVAAEAPAPAASGTFHVGAATKR